MSYFSANVEQITQMFPHVSANDLGGTSVIEDVLQAHTDNVKSLLTPEIYKRLNFPELEVVVLSAQQDQTTAVLGLTPILGEAYSNPVSLWRLSASITEEGKQFDFSSTTYYRGNNFYEAADEWSVNSIDTNTGAITFPELQSKDRLYATYTTDIEQISVTSLARAVCYGTAYELGCKIYAIDTNQWKLVETYKEIWEKALAAIESATFIPAELRKLRFFEPIQMKPSLKTFKMERSA